MPCGVEWILYTRRATLNTLVVAVEAGVTNNTDDGSAPSKCPSKPKCSRTLELAHLNGKQPSLVLIIPVRFLLCYAG